MTLYVDAVAHTIDPATRTNRTTMKVIWRPRASLSEIHKNTHDVLASRGKARAVEGDSDRGYAYRENGESIANALGILSLGLGHHLAGASSALRRQAFAHDHRCLPPVDASRFDLVLGLRHTLAIVTSKANGQHLRNFHRNLFGAYKNTVSMLIMGQRLIMTNEPENLKAILATQFSDFGMGERRRDIFADMLSIGIFNADGDAWAHARAIIRPTWRAASSLTLACSRGTSKSGWTTCQSGRMMRWIYRIWHIVLPWMSAPSFCATGRPTPFTPRALSRVVGSGIDTASDVIMMRMQLGKLWRLYNPRKNREACQAVKNYVDPMVHEAVAKAKNAKQRGDGVTEDDPRYTFLGALASQDLSPDEVRSHVLNMLFAAHASTASLMASVFRFLAEDSRVQRRLRQEIWNGLEGRRSTYEDVRSLTYLNWVTKETLRLYPLVPQNIRGAVKDTLLPAVRLATLYIRSTAGPTCGRDDAGDFRPERWETISPMFQYLPFNAGPRICPGQSFGQADAGYFITRFLQEYTVLKKPEHVSAYRENLHLVLSAKGGVRVIVDR
ncbi:Uu.00g143660.m01.CDS01 [Anthostomella pinea]|uniref:Uu.00g143660.m01.CDS01 n=1 Tax=Anthostomella pinea TaxID=933095 RepID=A0AAI8VK76_9PEZI|nr:Uu.00g143660.m01.CDS01 [Anthostomella pinea]